MERDLVEYIAKSLVDDPSAVSVSEKETDRGNVLELRVASNDVGKVIGKFGRVAQAIRTLLMASAGRGGTRYLLEILD